MTAPSPARVTWISVLAWFGGSWAFRSPARKAKLLRGFASTEEQSQLELRQAAAACDDARRRACYLRHALDEARHARAFAVHAAALANETGAAELARPTSPACEGLFERLGEARFLAFVQRGERRGRIEFETYAKLLRRRGATAHAELFERLVADERHHEAYSARLLEELVGPAGARRTLRWAAAWEAWRAFRRRGQGLANGIYALTMWLAYVICAPLGLLVRAAAPRRHGFQREL